MDQCNKDALGKLCDPERLPDFKDRVEQLVLVIRESHEKRYFENQKIPSDVKKELRQLRHLVNSLSFQAKNHIYKRMYNTQKEQGREVIYLRALSDIADACEVSDSPPIPGKTNVLRELLAIQIRQLCDRFNVKMVTTENGDLDTLIQIVLKDADVDLGNTRNIAIEICEMNKKHPIVPKSAE
jgi:hypothetical protein